MRQGPRIRADRNPPPLVLIEAYHVLGGTLSALDGVRPEDLNIASLIRRAGEGNVAEVILDLAEKIA